MDDKSFHIRVPKRWVRVAMIVGVTALIVAPLTAIASHNSFTDVPDSNTFHDDIGWLADAGVTKGCNPPDNTQYCPDEVVTRGQMAAFMNRFAGYIGATDGTPAQADNATTADSATNADNATTADTADTVVDDAITQSKIANGAVGTDQIALDAQGVALAGVQFNGDGSIRGWFNRFGGAPTVSNPSTGVYEVSFPGLEGQLGPDALIVATDADAPLNHIRQFLAGGNDIVNLRTYDASGGALADADVNLVVMASNSIAVTGASATSTNDSSE